MLASFTRAKQFASEKMGKAEKTEYEAVFEKFCAQVDSAKDIVEKIIKQTELYLEPNTGRRLGQSVNDTLHRKVARPPNELESLGNVFTLCGMEYGVESPFGGGLLKSGQLQTELGEGFAQLQTSVREQFMKPMRAFVDQDIRAVAAERKALNTRRLDLDAAKATQRTAPSPEHEEAARIAAEAFQKQYEITRVLLERATRTTDAHINRIIAFLDAQHAFFSAAAQKTANLSRDLRRSFGLEPPTYMQSLTARVAASSSSPPAPTTAVPATPSLEFPLRAHVLCSYEPRQEGELELTVDEIVFVKRDPSLPAGWSLAQAGGKQGRVHDDYLEFLDE